VDIKIWNVARISRLGSLATARGCFLATLADTFAAAKKENYDEIRGWKGE
jgi:hypothetical protein